MARRVRKRRGANRGGVTNAGNASQNNNRDQNEEAAQNENTVQSQTIAQRDSEANAQSKYQCGEAQVQTTALRPATAQGKTTTQRHRTQNSNKAGKVALTLEEESIYVERFGEHETLRELQDLFQIVFDVRSLEAEGFAASTNLAEQNKAARDYNKQLVRRSKHLSRKCLDPLRVDDNELEWVSILRPAVLYRFHREEEERAPYHHCFVCRLHHAFGSRPILNKRSERSHMPRKDYQVGICEYEEHINVPNFETVQQMTYLDEKTNTKRIPDVTIGLTRYDLAQYPWTERSELAQDARIKFFDGRLLRELRDHFKIPVPFLERKRRVRDSFLQFPFALWEAKTETAETNHQIAMHQTAVNLKGLLKWQQDFYAKAQLNEQPVVWYLSNVGAYWKIYGCFLRPNAGTSDGYTYILMELWSGDIRDPSPALQLLYIIDIMAIWGEHDFKPLVGTCMQRLFAEKTGADTPTEAETMLSIRLPLNKANFAWIFDPNDKRTASTEQIPKVSVTPSLTPFRSRHTRHLSSSSQSRTLSVRRLTPSNERTENQLFSAARSIMPEMHDYTWILDNDPGNGDLLILRIDRKGATLDPIVVFENAEWSQRDFRNIIKHERKRQPSSVLFAFNLDRDGKHYLWRYIFQSPEYIGNTEIQFCAILPIEHNAYRRQRKLRAPEQQVFNQVETLCEIAVLMANLDSHLNKWCVCKGIWDPDVSPSMIRCDNIKCKIEWYHKPCVELDDDFETDQAWICPSCRRNPVELPQIDRADLEADYDEDILLASYDRVERVRTVSEVWFKHDWPSQDSVLAIFEEISCSIDIGLAVEKEITEYGNEGRDKGCWALTRAEPRRLSKVQLATNLEPQAEYSLDDLTYDTGSLGLSGSTRT